MRPRPPMLLALALAAAAWDARQARGDELVRMPGPAPQAARDPGPAQANARCEGCHEDVAREWRASMHAQSNTDPVFRRALAIEPFPLCRGCHAPEADPGADAPPVVSAVGVGCVTCHVTAPGPDAATLATGSSGSAAPHPVMRDPAFGTPLACAGCHEFDFPEAAPHQAPERMQSTVSEHAVSRFAGTSCVECHMVRAPTPQRPGHRSHLFGASRDLARLRSAVRVRGERVSPSSVRLTLTSGRVGHAFPTGDLFRRLVVSAEAVGDDWFVVSEASRQLRRRFEVRPMASGHFGRHVVADDRVGVDASTPVTLDLGEQARGRAIAWRVEYQRVEHPLGGDGSEAVLAGSAVVAEGFIAATGGGR